MFELRFTRVGGAFEVGLLQQGGSGELGEWSIPLRGKEKDLVYFTKVVRASSEGDVDMCMCIVGQRKSTSPSQFGRTNWCSRPSKVSLTVEESSFLSWEMRTVN